MPRQQGGQEERPRAFTGPEKSFALVYNGLLLGFSSV